MEKDEDISGMGNLMLNYTREYGVGAHSSVYQVFSNVLIFSNKPARRRKVSY